MKKLCRSCGCEWEATTKNFYRSSKTADGLRPSCIICILEKQQIHYIKNLERERARKREAYWQNKEVSASV